jgi:hypothetical protein
MNPEKPELDIPSVEIKYDRKTLSLKRDIQMAVIFRFCEGDVHNTERVTKWINSCSKDFRDIFEQRLIQDDGFLELCETNPDRVVEEITEELKKRHQFPTVLDEVSETEEAA